LGGGQGQGRLVMVAAATAVVATSSRAADTRLPSPLVLGFATTLGPASGLPRRPVASSAAAVDATSTVVSRDSPAESRMRGPTAGTHSLCAVTVLRRRPSSRWLEHVRPDRCPQPTGGAGVLSLGNGQRSDIPHVLQQRYTSLPSPITTIFHYVW
jgi:hypothetical protein